MSVAAACCRVSERGHASLCTSRCDAEVCPPADSLQPATTDSRGPRQEQPIECKQHGTGEQHFHERATATSHLTRRLLPNAGLPPCWSVCVRVCATRCSAPVSAAAAASAGWLAGWLTLHKHTQVNSPHTQPVHRLAQCGESGSGVTSRCLSGSGPRPRRLAPPLPNRHHHPSHPIHPSTQSSHLAKLESKPRHYSSLVEEVEEEEDTDLFTGQKSLRWKISKNKMTTSDRF